MADCTQEVFANVTYVPTDRKDEDFDPKRADKYYKCACKITKVDGKCISSKICKTEAIIYNVQRTPIGHTYLHQEVTGPSFKKNKLAH